MLALGSGVGAAVVPLPERPYRLGQVTRESAWHTVGAWRLNAPRSCGCGVRPERLGGTGGTGGTGAAGRGPSASEASSLQPPEEDAAIVGAVRLLSVLIATFTMDLAGRKVLLFVSGELRRLPHVGSPQSSRSWAPRGGRRAAGSSEGPWHAPTAPERSAGPAWATGSRAAAGLTGAQIGPDGGPSLAGGP